MAIDTIAVYVHIPWCVRKCPYCDFNSHKAGTEPLPEAAYIARLEEDLREDLARLGRRPLISSLFIGGGTPSLFSADSIDALLTMLNRTMGFAEHAEITMEANPGTFESERFAAYRAAGVNRLSIGIQSFDDDKLKALGRIHNAQNAVFAIQEARRVGFDNINIDLMHGLPNQTVEEALSDLTTGLSLQPDHLSWYQLTIETNTEFYSAPPPIPDIDILDDIEDAGFEQLREMGFHQYEVSAWTINKPSQHNLHYWHFDDYLGIGAGAHGKITLDDGSIIRRRKTRQPNHYLDNDKQLCAEEWAIEDEHIIFEFMLNRLRLFQPTPFAQFESATGQNRQWLKQKLTQELPNGLVDISETEFKLTFKGQRFLNNVLNIFLPKG